MRKINFLLKAKASFPQKTERGLAFEIENEILPQERR